MTETLPEYELFAIRYAMRDAKRTDHFIGGDPHDAPMAMDYFLWVAKSPEHTFIIDTGFTEELEEKFLTASRHIATQGQQAEILDAARQLKDGDIAPLMACLSQMKFSGIV